MNPDPIAISLITLGAIFLAGLAADIFGRHTRVPRVSLLLLLGVCVGPLGFDLFPESSKAWFPSSTSSCIGGSTNSRNRWRIARISLTSAGLGLQLEF